MEEIHIIYRAEDYLDANRIWLYSKFNNFKIIRLGAILFSIFFGLFLLSSLLTYNVANIFINLLFFLFFLAFVFYEWTILPFESKSLFKQQKTFSQEVIFQFEESLIFYSSCVEDVNLKWFEGHIKAQNMLLIVVTKKTFMFVPKKYCASEAQYERICEIVADFPQGNV